ncbi:unnamed protein product [Rotaria sp. Silwood2]|nr:unnamed protein product [Rotaria sp. Silwood2]
MEEKSETTPPLEHSISATYRLGKKFKSQSKSIKIEENPQYIDTLRSSIDSQYSNSNDIDQSFIDQRLESLLQSVDGGYLPTDEPIISTEAPPQPSPLTEPKKEPISPQPLLPELTQGSGLPKPAHPKHSMCTPVFQLNIKSTSLPTLILFTCCQNKLA